MGRDALGVPGPMGARSVVRRAAHRRRSTARQRDQLDAAEPVATRAAMSMIERDFAGAVVQLDAMGGASRAALARLWASEWLVEHGRTAEASPFLEHSLAFWRSSARPRTRVAASHCSQPPRELLTAWTTRRV